MEIKRVGILTFVKVGNYGAELQAYALSRILREVYGCEAQIFDCSIKSVSLQGFENRIQCRKSLKNRLKLVFVYALENLFSAFFFMAKKGRINKFREFYAKCMVFTPFRVDSFQMLYESDFCFDAIIVGSDQVWNYTYPFSPEPFLLTFVPRGIRKISYAASFGRKDLPSTWHDLYRKALGDFYAVSVRETTAVSILEELGISSVEVLDPTFLLTKEEWRESLNLSFDVDNKEERYVLVYELLRSDSIIKLARRIADRYHCKIIYLSSRIFPLHFLPDITCVCAAGPREFVQFFMNASFVLTTSFHGTAFALNFNIPFYSLINRKRVLNSRIVDLLKLVGLQDRLVYDDSLDSMSSFDMSFEQSMNKLDELRSLSFSFLTNSLS